MEWMIQHERRRGLLLLLDPQVDFHSNGAVSVEGADEDSEAFADFISQFAATNNSGSSESVVNDIIVTLDTHQVMKSPLFFVVIAILIIFMLSLFFCMQRMQVFHAVFWKRGVVQDIDGADNDPLPLSLSVSQPLPFDFDHPIPGTVISVADVERGLWVPRQSHHKVCLFFLSIVILLFLIVIYLFISVLLHFSGKESVLEYLRSLAKQGRFVLRIQPEHCLLGCRGHSVVPTLNQALQVIHPLWFSTFF